MSEILIPKESEYILTAIYNEFLIRYTNGVPRDKAKIFRHQDNVLKLVPEIWEEDLSGLLDELKNLSLISGTKGSGVYMFVTLTTTGITYMENRVGNKLENVAKALIALKSLLPTKN
ncbi:MULTISPECIES: hypothetical protein [Enterococcus]|uniref:hypothetical protein n=1 Tax=Enterococcus TaxID=1350 RepID=UPI002649A2D9|nr:MULTISPECIES: hypothetical protein [Enterococcus]MDN6004548.1 hypothetical protein [Enterococcus sp.]MDN6559970.1 hypothetical protein [Enterococcus sp.]MDN6776658.1 hypothetical protein [Enterococcus sp.]MDT2479758.1 hypothetical protein [Enterococcus avium]